MKKAQSDSKQRAAAKQAQERSELAKAEALAAAAENEKLLKEQKEAQAELDRAGKELAAKVKA